MINLDQFSIGQSFTVQKLITEKDTSLQYGNGKIEKLLATPQLVAMMIEAGALILDEHLPEGIASVTKDASVKHFAPSAEGMMVTVKVEITKLDGNIVTFNMTAYDEVGQIGEGYHERAIVDIAGLMKKAEERKSQLNNMNR